MLTKMKFDPHLFWIFFSPWEPKGEREREKRQLKLMLLISSCMHVDLVCLLVVYCVRACVCVSVRISMVRLMMLFIRTFPSSNLFCLCARNNSINLLIISSIWHISWAYTMNNNAFPIHRAIYSKISYANPSIQAKGTMIFLNWMPFHVCIGKWDFCSSCFALLCMSRGSWIHERCDISHEWIFFIWV